MDSAALEVIREVKARISQRKLYTFNPYPWQREFFNAGIDNAERLLMAANGVGKTISGGFEVACHLTGEYPDWWQGRRFEGPVLVWVGSITNQTQRDYTQPILLGDDLGEGLGTGFIPKPLLISKPRIRQAGIGDVVDMFQVRHKSGGISRAVMKTYEQGWRMWQGAAPDVIWMDEQPDENAANEKPIFAEAQTRVFRSGGIILMTLTPLLGETDTITHFMNPQAPGIWWIGATWDDAPHLKEEDKARLEQTYPDYQRDTRTKGVPMMGEGRVFTVAEDDFKIPPRDIPDEWARIKGIDFGIAHPAAVADLAWDRDSDIIYVTRVWRRQGCDAAEHAQAINDVDPWVPVAWPHDGTNREKKGGERLKDAYVAHQVRMLGKSARYVNDKGGSQPVEPVILEVETRLIEGRFKVFSGCKEFFDEYRNYHRKDGRVVALKDDVLKAVFYGVMMRRYAMPRRRSLNARSHVPTQPTLSMRI